MRVRGIKRRASLSLVGMFFLGACASSTEPTPESRATISGYFAAAERPDVHLFLYDDVDGPQPEQYFVEETSPTGRALWWGIYAENGSELAFTAYGPPDPSTPQLTNATWSSRPTAMKATVSTGIGVLTLTRAAADPPGGRAIFSAAPDRTTP